MGFDTAIALRPSLKERRQSRKQQYGVLDGSSELDRAQGGNIPRPTLPHSASSEVESLSIDSILAQGFQRKHGAGAAQEGLSPAPHSASFDGELTPSTADSLCSQLDAFPSLPASLHSFYPSLTTKSSAPSFAPPPPSSYTKPLSPPLSPASPSFLQTKNLPLKPTFIGKPICPSPPPALPIMSLPTPPSSFVPTSDPTLQKDLPLTPMKDEVEPIFDPATPPKQSLPSLPSSSSVTSLESIIGRRAIQRSSSGTSVPLAVATTHEEIPREPVSPSSSSGRPLDASDALTPLSATFPLGLGLTTPKNSPRSTNSLNTLRTVAVIRNATPDGNLSPTKSSRVLSPLSSPIQAAKPPDAIRPVVASSIIQSSTSSTDSDEDFDLMNADDIFSRTEMGLSSSSDSETEDISIENINKAIERRKGRTTAFATLPKRDSVESAKRSSASESRRGSTVSSTYDITSPTGERKASFASDSRLSVGSLSPSGGWSPRNSIPYKLVRKASFRSNSPRLSFASQTAPRNSPLAVKEDFAAEELERRLEMCSSEEEEIFDRSLDVNCSASRSPRSASVKLSPRNPRLRRRATAPEGTSPSALDRAPTAGYRFPSSPPSIVPTPMAVRPIRKQSLAALISEEVEKEMDLDGIAEPTTSALLPEIQLRESPVLAQSIVEVVAPKIITPPTIRTSSIPLNTSIPRSSSLPRPSSSIPRPSFAASPSPSPSPTPVPTAREIAPTIPPPSRMKPPSQRTPPAPNPLSPPISSGPLGLRQLRLGRTHLSPPSSPLSSPPVSPSQNVLPRKSLPYLPPSSFDTRTAGRSSIPAPSSSISKIGRLRQPSYTGVAL